MNKILVAAAVAGVAVAANAGVSFTDTQTQTFSGIPNFDTSFAFDLFDAANYGNPAFVTLLSAEIFLDVEIADGELLLDNDGIDPAVVNAELGASAFANSSFNPFINLSANAVTQGAFNLDGNNGDSGSFDNQDVSEGDFGQLLGNTATGSDSLLFSGLLAQIFAGVGTWDLDIDVNQIIDFGGVGGVSFGGTPVNATITARVVYTYTIVPAPAGAAVLGLGGLALARRRR